MGIADLEIMTIWKVFISTALLLIGLVEAQENLATTAASCGLQLVGSRRVRQVAVNAPPLRLGREMNTTSIDPIDLNANNSEDTLQQQSLINNNQEPLIVGGSNTYRGEFPFIISLTYSGSHICGGSVIHEQFVLSAAHCFIPNYFGSPSSPSNMAVRIKEYIRSNTNEVSPNEESIDVTKAILHPEYASTSKPSTNDIMLLKLTTAITWDSYVQPVCLAPQGYSTDDKPTATVIGWGTTIYGASEGNDVLLKVDLPVVTNKVCKILNGFNIGYKLAPIQDSHLCAGYWKGGRDSCQGDSGGPLFVKVGGKFTQIGVVSEGLKCGKFLTPGYYTRTSYYLQWIKDTISAN